MREWSWLLAPAHLTRENPAVGASGPTPTLLGALEPG